MDALSRRQMWALLRKLNEKQLTIMLTTHYMEEAQNLCNRVAFLNTGKLDEINTPANLIEQLGSYAVDISDPSGIKSSFYSTKQEAIEYLSSLSAEASLRRTTLEDVFIENAGRRQGEH